MVGSDTQAKCGSAIGLGATVGWAPLGPVCGGLWQCVRPTHLPSLLGGWGLSGPCPVRSLIQAFQHAAHTLRQLASLLAGLLPYSRCVLPCFTAVHQCTGAAPDQPADASDALLFQHTVRPLQRGRRLCARLPIQPTRRGAHSHQPWAVAQHPRLRRPNTGVCLDVLPGVLCCWHDRLHCRPCL